jgi:hypothetical protein
MVRPQVEFKPVQGGFIVIRPDINKVYEEEFKAIIRTGDFRDGKGWGSKRTY